MGRYAITRLLHTVIPLARVVMAAGSNSAALRAKAAALCAGAVRVIDRFKLTSGFMSATFLELRGELEVHVAAGALIRAPVSPSPFDSDYAPPAESSFFPCDAVTAVFAQVMLEHHGPSPLMLDRVTGARASSVVPARRPINIYRLLLRASKLAAEHGFGIFRHAPVPRRLALGDARDLGSDTDLDLAQPGSGRKRTRQKQQESANDVDQHSPRKELDSRIEQDLTRAPDCSHYAADTASSTAACSSSSGAPELLWDSDGGWSSSSHSNVDRFRTRRGSRRHSFDRRQSQPISPASGVPPVSDALAAPQPPSARIVRGISDTLSVASLVLPAEQHQTLLGGSPYGSVSQAVDVGVERVPPLLSLPFQVLPRTTSLGSAGSVFG
jgi:hypothetical protein